MPPVVTAIVPCYNQSKFLIEAVNSVLNQSISDIECIIVNDGSSDDTRDIAVALAQLDQRVRYIEQENQGLASARNTGLRHARGTYLQFLDSDDILLPKKIEKQLRTLESTNSPGLSICDYYLCEADDTSHRIIKRGDFEHPRFLRDDPLIDLIERWESELSIPVHSFLFDARLFRSSNIFFDEHLQNHEDWDCWMRIFTQRPVVTFVHEELVAYRQHESSMTMNQVTMWKGFDQALRKQQEIFATNKKIQKLLKKKHDAMHYRYLGKHKSQLLNIFDNLLEMVKYTGKKLAFFYRNITPWPIQKTIHKLLNFKPQQPHR